MNASKHKDTLVSGKKSNLIKILVILVVIGAGTAGPVTAAGAAGPGAKAALIEGRFKGGDCLSVGSVPSKAIISAARASAPPIDGIDTVPHLTNENRFSLTALPKRIGIIGAGPIGCVMAQSFARLGSEVSLVDSAPGIFIKEDPDAADIVRKQLVRDGVNLLCYGSALKLPSAPGNDGVRMYVESEGKGDDLTVDQILVAVARAPKAERMNLEKVGVEFNKRRFTPLPTPHTFHQRHRPPEWGEHPIDSSRKRPYGYPSERKPTHQRNDPRELDRNRRGQRRNGGRACQRPCLDRRTPAEEAGP